MLNIVKLGPFEYFEISLWLICIAISLYIGISFLQNYKKLKNITFFWISLFFFLLILGRFFRMILKYYIGMPPIGALFEGEALVFETIFLFTMYAALFFLYFGVERIFKKSHYIFSFLVIILTITAAINMLYLNILFYVFLGLFTIILMGIPFIFIYMGRKSSGNLKKNSFIVAIGAIVAEMGLVLDVPEGFVMLADLGFLDIIKIVAPLLQIIGFILIKIGYSVFAEDM